MTPISLFTAMTDTTAVSGLMAFARSCTHRTVTQCYTAAHMAMSGPATVLSATTHTTDLDKKKKKDSTMP